MPADTASLEAEFQRSEARYIELHSKLNHVFNHVTATFEGTARRLDQIEAKSAALVVKLESLTREVRSTIGVKDQILYDFPLSGIAGIGQFVHENLPPAEVEALRFQEAIERRMLELYSFKP